ncbi:hypothetical protein GCM10028793_30180 [Nocardiopsis oceani]
MDALFKDGDRAARGRVGTGLGLPWRVEGSLWAGGSLSGLGFPLWAGVPSLGWGSLSGLGFPLWAGVPSLGWGSLSGLGFPPFPPLDCGRLRYAPQGRRHRALRASLALHLDPLRYDGRLAAIGKGGRVVEVCVGSGFARTARSAWRPMPVPAPER